MIGEDRVPASTTPGAGDVVTLGDATTADESQEIVLDGDVEILALEMEATGNRDYVISSFPDDTHSLTISGRRGLLRR